MTAGSEDRAFFGHPRGIAYLAFTEAWERFSYSGMQALLVLYMTEHLLRPGRAEAVVGFGAFRAFLEHLYGPLAPQPLSSATYGLYTGLVFFAPVIGGVLGDRRFGQHTMVLTGALLMALGHFLMAFEAPFLFALLLLIAGAGCLKGNISTQVGSLYSDGDRRRADGFQIFSMATNIGVIVAPLVCGTLGELWGWHFGFGAAGIGMLIGLCIYIVGRRHLPPDTLAKGRERTAEAWPESRGMMAILVLCFAMTTVFLIAAGQLGNVYSLWLRDAVDRSVGGGLAIPVTWFQSFTPFFSVLLTPFIMTVWERQARSGREPSLFAKIAVGLTMVSVGLLLLAGISTVPHPIWWMVVPTHVLVCIGYIFVYPVSLALFSQAAPRGARAMYIGLFFLSSFLAGNLVGWLGGFYATMPSVTFWALHGWLALGAAMLALIAVRPSRAVLAPI